MLKNENVWMLVAILCGAVGCFIGFLTVGGIGAATSGSGCGSKCLDTARTLVTVGLLFLGASLFSACYAMNLASIKRGQAPRSLGYMIKMTLGVLTILITGLFFFFLMSLTGSL
ncbi:hypothetical protein C9426_09825 [Serratia sp. S1B]|nr:hypothetical protein C9426_09825 [Serratia sp. S1B]